MTGRLRSILGGSNRVKKKSSGPKARNGGGNNNRASPSSSSSSWSASLPRTKPSTLSEPAPEKSRKQQEHGDDKEAEGEEVYNSNEPLPDGGLVHTLLTDLTLRDVPQAMHFSHRHMFTPLPEQPSSYGLNSTRVADVLNFRRHLPPLTTTMHLHALLRSPTAVERETAELVRAGTLRKVVLLRRGAGNKAGGGVVEFLMTAQDLEARVYESDMTTETKEAFVKWLRAHPVNLQVSSADIDKEDGGLQASHVDRLVRAGFLTTFHDFDIGHVSSNFARPEDIGTMLSLQSISRAATGSSAAVGGSDALHNSGGSGGARSGGGGGGGGADVRLPGAGAAGAGSDLSVAVPGQGAYLKLLTAAVTHLTTGLLGKARYKEMPHGLLRERWDGGVANESRQHAGKKSRREFTGVLPGRTRKWREFSGLAFDWVLHEAVGAGLVEVFETGSVGRAVRLL